MRISVPDSEFDSTPSSPVSFADSFHSLQNINSPILSRDTTLPKMDTQPSSNNATTGDFSLNSFIQNLTPADRENLARVLLGNRRSTNSDPQLAPVITQRVVNLPKWNGRQEDFAFYMDMLRIRFKKEVDHSREASSICIDIIDTLPDDKKPRVANWFADSKASGLFSWKDLLQVLQNEFEDSQAQIGRAHV